MRRRTRSFLCLASSLRVLLPSYTSGKILRDVDDDAGDSSYGVSIVLNACSCKFSRIGVWRMRHNLQGEQKYTTWLSTNILHFSVSSLNASRHQKGNSFKKKIKNLFQEIKKIDPLFSIFLFYLLILKLIDRNMLLKACMKIWKINEVVQVVKSVSAQVENAKQA